jgi:hypothetical protein
MTPEASAAWNEWWRQCYEPERIAMCDGVAAAVLEMIKEDVDPLERQIKDLERKLAEAVDSLNREARV